MPQSQQRPSLRRGPPTRPAPARTSQKTDTLIPTTAACRLLLTLSRSTTSNLSLAREARTQENTPSALRRHTAAPLPPRSAARSCEAGACRLLRRCPARRRLTSPQPPTASTSSGRRRAKATGPWARWQLRDQ